MEASEKQLNRAEPRDEELVRSVLAGRTQDFDILVRRYSGMLFILAHSRINHKEAAEDLVQEVFLRAFIGLNELKQPQFFSTWLGRIMRNLATDWVRTKQRRSRLVPLVYSEEMAHDVADTEARRADEMIEDKENSGAVQEALKSLPPKLREIVLLKFNEDLSIREIAGILDRREWVVQYQLKKALKMMKVSLEPLIREAATPFKAPGGLAVRSITVVTAAAALSFSAKASLAAAAGNTGGLSYAAAANSGGSFILSSMASLFQALSTVLVAGSKTFLLNKTTGAAVVLFMFLGGGIYYQNIKESRIADSQGANDARPVTGLPAGYQPVPFADSDLSGETPGKFSRLVKVREGEKIVCAVTGKVLKDVEVKEMYENQLAGGEYYDDGTHGDDLAGDGILSRVTVRRDLISEEAYAVREKLDRICRTARDMSPVDFYGAYIAPYEAGDGSVSARVLEQKRDEFIMQFRIKVLADYINPETGQYYQVYRKKAAEPPQPLAASMSRPVIQRTAYVPAYAGSANIIAIKERD